jgi:iron(III) transport system ATP-binding protein
LIEVRQVAKTYGESTVLASLSFEVPDGGSLAIMGPSGCGKTTLLRLIAGLEPPDEGEIYLGGRMVSSKKYLLPPYRREIGMVFQSPALWPHMTVAENVRYGLKGIPRGAAKERVEELLERMGIGELINRFPGEISGGQARRAALARALAPCPRYLLLDEPLTNVEAQLKEKLISLILEEKEKHGATLVCVTHERSEAQRLADRVVVLEGGLLK